MKSEPNFFGKDGQYWWVGVVEDRRDPLKLGRLRVRILGAHTEVKALIPSCELHWAYVYQPITQNPSMSGLGHSPTGPVEGTWVHGFFKDADAGQDPIVMGTIGGIPEEAANPNIGFYDPGMPFHELPDAPRKIRSRHYPNDGTGAQLVEESSGKLYPRVSHPWGNELGEPDTNRLARAEKVDDTIIGVRRRQRDVGVPVAMAHPTPSRKWNEPEPSYNAQYPYNHVFESESGHIVEFDDTPGHERINVIHRTGTGVEIDMEGNLVVKVVGKRYEITMENSYSHFQNTMNLTVDGEVNIYCRSDANLQIDGNMKMHVQGNVEEKIHGNYTTDIDGNRTVKVGGSDTLEVKGSQNMHVGLSTSRHAGLSITDVAGATIRQAAGSTFTMTALALINLDALAVKLNSFKPTPAFPTLPQSPSVPPFPAQQSDWYETKNETGSNPVKESKPDSSSPTSSQSDC